MSLLDHLPAQVSRLESSRLFFFPDLVFQNKFAGKNENVREDLSSLYAAVFEKHQNKNIEYVLDLTIRAKEE